MLRGFQPDTFVSPDELVRKSISLAHADRTGHVSVAGPNGLLAMVSLCRDGFEHVECARKSTCASADEASDVLLIVGRLASEDLAILVSRTGRLLKDGGLLVAQLGGPADDAVVRRALQAVGLAAHATVFDLAAGCLVSHRVRHTSPRLRAVPWDRSLQALRSGPGRGRP